VKSWAKLILALALLLSLAGPAFGSLRQLSGPMLILTAESTPYDRLGAKGFRLLIRSVGKCLELFR